MAASTSSQRLSWGLCLLLGASVLGTARWLTPSPTGVGTHTQLGLPPCAFLALLGVPCPACGLTTSFAHLAHLQVAASLRVHPLGLPLFLATLMLTFVSFAGALRGSLCWPWLSARIGVRGGVIVICALLAVWTVRLLALAFA